MAERPPADRPPHDDRSEPYSWLYGGQRPAERQQDATPDLGPDREADPEATQAIPRPDRQPPGQQPPVDPEQTSFLPSEQQRSPRADATRREPVPAAPLQQARPPPLPPPNLPPPSGARATPPPVSRRPKRRRWWLRIILGLLALWLVFLVAVPIWAWSKIAKVDAEPAGDRPPDQPGTTYLIVGSDSREGLTEDQRQNLSTGGGEGAGRTDTIMLLHTGDGAPLLLSIPRDSLVEVPGYGTTKINAAFAFEGPPLLVETIEQNTGIRVDDYIEIGFGGFVNVVDAVGGVDICADEAITDPKAGLTGDTALAKGCQEVGGIQALGFARTRQTFATSDIQRVQNQRAVVAAIADKAASPWSVLNPVRYFNLSDAGASSLRIGDNVGPLSLLRFAWALGHVTGGDGRTCTVPIADLAVHWDPDRAPQVFDLIAEDRADDISRDLCTPDGLPR
ncbi:MAG: LCP family protein [Nocardioidaceae bacterium]|nr:LCP family protein [Nocardioidaceae bacterium]